MIKYTICFIKRGDQILLLNREKAPWMGCWNGVGGKLAPEEHPRASVLREVHEETGIQLEHVHFKGLVTWRSDGQNYGGMYLYFAELDAAFVYPDLVQTEEGILAWKSVDWIMNGRNQGLAANIPHFLPALIQDERCFDHYCIFEKGLLAGVESQEIAAAKEHGE